MPVYKDTHCNRIAGRVGKTYGYKGRGKVEPETAPEPKRKIKFIKKPVEEAPKKKLKFKINKPMEEGPRNLIKGFGIERIPKAPEVKAPVVKAPKAPKAKAKKTFKGFSTKYTNLQFVTEISRATDRGYVDPKYTMSRPEVLKMMEWMKTKEGKKARRTVWEKEFDLWTETTAEGKEWERKNEEAFSKLK